MLRDKNAATTIGVKNIAAARKFYGETLGLAIENSEGDRFSVYRSGTSVIIVYQTPFAGTNQATAMTWMLGEEFDQVIASLKSKGITFEHYDLPGIAREGDIHLAGKMKLAWFKDPDGNILHLGNQ